jgi:type VII secretion-associated protein (TIGR03931 family)
VSAAVVVVGPTVITGPGVVAPELAASALDCIDDDLALVDDHAVPADDLWRDVLGAASAGARAAITLICPSWWPTRRVERVRAAAGGWSPNVITLRRSEALATATTIVEVAPELAVVHVGAQRHAIARVDESSRVVDAVVARVDGLPAVTLDVPAGHAAFGAELDLALRRKGIDVAFTDDQRLVDAVQGPRGYGDSIATSRWRPTSRAAVVVVAVLAAGALAATAVGLDGDTVESDGTTWLVEGRVAVEVPTQWRVERITSGPGSARVQVVSPMNPSDVIHLTQSWAPGVQTLDAAAETLRTALAEQPEGVFVDFTARGERAQRRAVTYAEIRAERRIDWTVLLDGGVRIAIGCEGSPTDCDRAVGSARAVTRK